MEMQVRDRIPALTTILTLVSLALVVGAVRGYVPTAVLPRAPDVVLDAIPTVNAAISALAIVVILSGLRAIKRGNVDRHRRLMLTGFGLFLAFLVLYLYRVSLVGPTHFAGPAWAERYLYLPILVVHMGLAIVCLPLLYYVLLLAYSHPVAELPATNHPRVGRIAAVLWLVSFALGIVVYLLLYVVY
jgi:putative membrane protein